MSPILSKKQQSVTPMITLKHKTEMIQIKIWKHEKYDVDEDGTKYYRCLLNVTEPFRLRVDDLEDFLTEHETDYKFIAHQ